MIYKEAVEYLKENYVIRESLFTNGSHPLFDLYAKNGTAVVLNIEGVSPILNPKATFNRLLLKKIKGWSYYISTLDDSYIINDFGYNCLPDDEL